MADFEDASCSRVRDTIKIKINYFMMAEAAADIDQYSENAFPLSIKMVLKGRGLFVHGCFAMADVPDYKGVTFKHKRRSVNLGIRSLKSMPLDGEVASRALFSSNLGWTGGLAETFVGPAM